MLADLPGDTKRYLFADSIEICVESEHDMKRMVVHYKMFSIYTSSPDQ